MLPDLSFAAEQATEGVLPTAIAGRLSHNANRRYASLVRRVKRGLGALLGRVREGRTFDGAGALLRDAAAGSCAERAFGYAAFGGSPFRLVHVQLAANVIGDDGVIALAHCARGSGALSSVRFLGLADNRVRDAGVAALAEAILDAEGTMPRL